MWLRDTRGRWHRSGQGLRRGILLGLRETAKSIAAGPELASGSDSRPCRNNAVSRSPSSNHPSFAAARSDATFLWLTLPADRKKPEYGTEANIKENIKETSKNPESRNQNPETRSAQRTTINIEEYRSQIGTVYHHKYRRIPEPDCRSAQRTIINIEEYRSQIGTAYHHKYRRIQKPDRHNVPF